MTTDDLAPSDTDRAALSALVDTFFAAFTSGPGLDARMGALRAGFVPGAVVTRTCGAEPAVYDVESFIAPRQALLAGTEVSDFAEWAENGRFEVWGDIGHWFGSYGKSWVQGGRAHTGRGMKTIQFIRTGAGWRITAAAWDDERAALAVPASHPPREHRPAP